MKLCCCYTILYFVSNVNIQRITSRPHVLRCWNTTSWWVLDVSVNVPMAGMDTVQSSLKSSIDPQRTALLFEHQCVSLLWGTKLSDGGAVNMAMDLTQSHLFALSALLLQTLFSRQ